MASAPSSSASALRANRSRVLEQAASGERAARLAMALCVLSFPAPLSTTLGLQMALGAWGAREPNAAQLWFVVGAGLFAAAVCVVGARALARRARSAGVAGPWPGRVVRLTPWLALVGLAAGVVVPLQEHVAFGP